MAIADTIQSMTENLESSYDITALSEIDMTGVNKNLQNLPDTIKRSYLDIMNNGYSKVWDNWEKVTGEGTSLTLNNTEQAPIKMDLKGNTSQTGTPTPSSPIPVNVVSGDNQITVFGTNYYSLTPGEQGAIDTSGNNSSNSSNWRSSGFIEVEPNTSYTFSVRNISSYTLRLYEYTSSKTFISPRIEQAGSSLTITTSNNTKYLRYTIYSVGVTMTQAFIDNIMPRIVKTGEEATYPINLPEGMELCKIGDYQDYFYKSSGKWYLHKEIGKYTINGTENISLNGQPSTFNAYTFDLSVVKTVENTNQETLLCCSCFQSMSASYILNHFIENTSAIISRNRIYFVVDRTTFPNATSMKDYFTNNNATLYIVLETPTDTEITYQPLIEQLNNLEKAMSYNGQTNISQVNNDLPFIISASALKEWVEL